MGGQMVDLHYSAGSTRRIHTTAAEILSQMESKAGGVKKKEKEMEIVRRS